MSLKKRLAALGAQAGSSISASTAPETASLKEQLARYGLADRVSAYPKPSAQSVDPAALAQVLGGTLVAEGLVCRERSVDSAVLRSQYPAVDWQQGGALQCYGLDGDDTGWWAIDTETTGLSTGAGTVVFLVGVAALTGHGVWLRQWLATGFAAERALLAALHAWQSDARGLISFNGKCFDYPLLQTRYRMNLPDLPFSGHAHADLLHPTRRLFRGQWPDCRLQTAEKYWLGFAREDDLPGSEAPAAWLDFVHAGQSDALCRVMQHNADDLLSLLALHRKMTAEWHRPMVEANILSQARWMRQRGLRTEARERLRGLDETEAVWQFAEWSRQDECWPDAAENWASLLDSPRHADAALALAKYHEHRTRDVRMALHYAERAAQATQDVVTPVLQQRIARLRARLAKAGDDDG